MHRLAYISPLPPATTGVADYSRELLPYLAQHIQLTCFATGDVDPALRQAFTCLPLAAFAPRRWAFDAALFHLGNSHHHAGGYDLFRRHPGVLVLHEAVMHHFLADHTAGRGDFPAYTRELAYELGPAGADLALGIQFAGTPHPLFALPLTRRLLDLSLGIITHSRHAAAQVRALTDRPVAAVPALVEPRTGHPRREQLGLPPETLLLGSFGLVTPARRVDVVLGALRRLRETRPAHLLIAGDVQPTVPLDTLIAELELGEHVTRLGRVPDLAAFVDWLATVDVVVNLRQPTAGETSATALRALVAGRPLIVSDAGWYAELPPDVAVRLPATDAAALAETLANLANDEARRAALGSAARAYARREHHGERVAAAYLGALADFLGWRGGYRG